MRCTQCDFENPATMRYCGGCGASLGVVCRGCGFGNPPTFAFCGACGQQLETASSDGVQGARVIERTLPMSLREKVLAQRETIEGERRLVTVMFCDLVGFTGLSEKMGPEEAYALMDEVYEILTRKVYEYEGTVNELTGDGIMALFGAPVALENAPQRSIRSAIAIHRGIAKFNEETRRRRRQLPALSMRIGINTGPVVVGTLGNDLRVEFKAVGDTVNLASRLEEMAEPGTTLIAEETLKLTEGLFRVEPLGVLDVRGKAQPVRAYRVIAPSTSRTRFDVSTARGLTPFVGRERELEILLDGYERVKEGRGQVVSISAEAGLGKSRLLYEFRKATSAEDLTFLEGRCLSYCRGLPYYPVIDLLRSSFDIGEGADANAVEARLRQGLSELGIEDSPGLPWLVDLLAADKIREGGSAYTPEARKALLSRAVTDLLLAASDRRPLILTIEDLHWIDQNTEELLGHILVRISASRVLVLLTYRPEYPHTWRARSYHSQLTLNRLSHRESLSMARHQLGGLDLEERLQDLILEKAEGIPFFIEEFVRSLRDMGLIEAKDGVYRLTGGEGGIAVPATIQDVLRARVDLLPEGARELLAAASVLGREIGHDLLRQLTGMAEDELLANLSLLKDAELFFERGIYPHSTYLFKHALTQEVVHDSILDPKRRELHRRAGKSIETVHRANLGEHYGALAEHYIAAKDFEDAARYCRLAGSRARSSGAFPLAIEYAKQHVESVSKLPANDQTRRMAIDARTTLAGYVLGVGRPHQAAEAVAPIVDAALASDEQGAHAAIHASVGLHELFATEDYSLAMQHLERVLEMPVQRGSATWHWFAAYYLGAFFSWTCDFERAGRYLRGAESMSKEAGRLEGVSVAQCTHGVALIHQGELQAAEQIIEEALVNAAESHNPTAEALTQAALGVLRYAQGWHEEACDLLKTGLRFTEDTAQSFWRSLDLGYLGDTWLALGSCDEARDSYRRSLSILEAAGLVPSWRNMLHLKLARTDAVDGSAQTDLEVLRGWRSASRLCIFEGCSARLVAETLLAGTEPDLGEVRHWLDDAIRADRDHHLHWELAQDHVTLAELHRQRDDRAALTDSLEKARRLFAHCGADGWVEEIDSRLASR